MKELLTVRIIFALNQAQQKLISTHLKTEKRNSLFQLYKLLLQFKEADEIDKSEVFLKIFKKKWTKDNDYLLRNELKLLKDKIETIIIEKQASVHRTEMEERIKLDFYHSLKITDEFILLHKNYVTKKIENFEYQKAIDYSMIYADYIRINIPNYKERAKIFDENLQQFRNLINQNFVLQESKYYALEAHLLLLQKQITNKKTSKIFNHNEINIHTQNYESAFVNYYIAYANAYKNFDISTIEDWENVFSILKTIPKNTIEIEKEYCYTLGNLATICSIRSNYKKADTYFELIFNTINEEIRNENITIILNYITNLNKLKKYENASKYLQLGEHIFGDRIKSFSQFRTQQIVVACYLNDIKKLGKLLAVDFETLQPFERIYYRLFYCIYFLIEDNIELAFTEIQNLQRSKLMNEIDTQFGLVADFFFVSIKNILAHHHKKKLSEKAIIEIKEVNQKVIDANFPMFLNYTPYLWMKERIGIES
jgi:hypothetical protein